MTRKEYTYCNKFYIGRTNRNFKTRFKVHRTEFIYAEEKSKLAEHIVLKDH